MHFYCEFFYEINYCQCSQACKKQKYIAILFNQSFSVGFSVPRECEMQSTRVWSILNHVIAQTLFGLSHSPIFLKFNPTCTSIQCKGAPICPPSMLINGPSVMILQLHSGSAILFQKIHPHLHRHTYNKGAPICSSTFSRNFTPTCTGLLTIRVHRYAHPQHIKGIKSSVYI